MVSVGKDVPHSSRRVYQGQLDMQIDAWSIP